MGPRPQMMSKNVALLTVALSIAVPLAGIADEDSAPAGPYLGQDPPGS